MIDLTNHNILQKPSSITIINNKQSPSSFFDTFLWEATIFRQERSQEGEKRAFIYA